jgi:hypothetical protein
MPRFLIYAVATLLAMSAPTLQARTVYRCIQDGSVSLASAPEPGSKCEARVLDDSDPRVPNLWGVNGTRQGSVYSRVLDGRTVYSTRELPGSTPVLAFTVTPPPSSPVHPGLGLVGRAQPDRYPQLFSAAARQNHVDDAFLRAIAHAESGFAADALSPKGAQGIMQLMPETAKQYAVDDPFSAEQSIAAGARHLRSLLKLYKGDRELAAAAYNAGQGAVARYGGVPPYAETRLYVAKVEALYALYTAAL